MCHSLYQLTSNSQSIHASPTLGNHKSDLCVSESVSVCVINKWYSTYTWYYMVFVPFWLTLRGMIISLSTCHCRWHHFILFWWLGAVPLHIFTTSSLCQWTFRLSPYLGHVNSAAVNVGVHVSIWMTAVSRYRPRSRAAGSHGLPFLLSLHSWATFCGPGDVTHRCYLGKLINFPWFQGLYVNIVKNLSTHPHFPFQCM